MRSKDHIKYEEVESYITKDNSIIKELMHPNKTTVKNLSLAEAIVKPNDETLLHIHKTSEEIYHITEGTGVMTLGEESFIVKKGDSILIPPNTPHKIKNTSTTNLRILCICSPPYSHEDTVIIDKNDIDF